MHPRGATLIELVIAITAIGIVLIGFLTLVIYNFRLQEIDRDSLIAGQLAREGIEVARAIRDSNWLEPSVVWYAGLLDGEDGDGTVDVVSRSIDFSVDSIDEAALYRHGTLISHQQLPDSDPIGFWRLVTITAVCDDDLGSVPDSSCAAADAIGMRVTATVQWINDARKRNLTVETMLYDWR